MLLSCWALGCSPAAFDGLANNRRDEQEPRDASLDAEGRDADGPDAEVADGAPAQPDAGTTDSDAGDAGELDAQVSDAAVEVDASVPQTQTFAIAKDEDDGFWYRPAGSLVEKFHFAPEPGFDEYAFEVGTDSEQCRTMLRFRLPLPSGTTVTAARLQFKRVGSESHAPATSTMRVHVFDTADMPPLDPSHQHNALAEHVPDGVWLVQSVAGFGIGQVGSTTSSPDLSTLVQHVLDRGDWRANGYIGFLLSPDVMATGKFAMFMDSSAARDPVTLTLTYQLP